MWRHHLTKNYRKCFSTAARTSRRWDHIGLATKDPVTVTAVSDAFSVDPSPDKINLAVGAYRDDQGKPVILQCVREAQEQIRDSDYSGSVSSLGLKVVEESVKLAYGRNDLRFAGVPALSGTGGCRLFAEFQRRFFPESPIYLPDPTWSNHYNIWTNASVPTRIYRYYHPHSKGLDFAALMNDVKNAPDGSFFLLHPCAHNPTGVDPTEEQWREISNLFKVKNHFPFFDMAYQGLVSGDMDRDAWSIRVFLDDGHLIGCSQSFSKTMGLFEHRVGCLSVLCSDTEKARQVQSQLHRITGAMYGSVPSHGLVLLSTVLSNPELKSLWTKEVKSMANHIQSTRSTLRESLELTGSNHNWEHITKQVGIFSLSGLTPDQIDRLADDFHIYTTPNGRISMTGITTSNVSYIANAFHEVTKAMMNKGSLFQTS